MAHRVFRLVGEGWLGIRQIGSAAEWAIYLIRVLFVFTSSLSSGVADQRDGRLHADDPGGPADRGVEFARFGLTGPYPCVMMITHFQQ